MAAPSAAVRGGARGSRAARGVAQHPEGSVPPPVGMVLRPMEGSGQGEHLCSQLWQRGG